MADSAGRGGKAQRSPSCGGPLVVALLLVTTAVFVLSVPIAESSSAGTRHGETGFSADDDSSDDDLRADTDLSDLLAEAERRALAIEIQGHELESLYATRVDPLVRALMDLQGDGTHAKRIALALVREGMRVRIDPRLLLAVVSVENPWLEPGALSPVGAVGLMQVMPFHAGGWGCASDDLTDPDANVCHGTRILAHALRRLDGDLERALLRYNGCVRGTNTPDCHLYPSRVLAYAESADGS